jgi:hypothetical protein
MKFFILTIILIAALFGTTARAQNEYSEQDAIDAAAAHEAFDAGLEATPGWYAAAYNTGNAYGVWHVEFWDADGDTLGWADVNPKNGRVYSWEEYFGVTEDQRASAEEILRPFVSDHPDVRELIEEPSIYDMYVDYDGWSDMWGVYIDRGGDSLYLLVEFLDAANHADPVLRGIFFSEVLSYDEWFAASSEAVSALAFELPEIAAALRDAEAWTSDAERVGNNTWEVTFNAGDAVLARATVDLDDSAVIDYSVEG